MAAFHYVQNNLLMLSLASPPFFCPAVFFLRRSHWQLYHLMRSDFIKEGPLTTFPRSFNANASISRTGWQQIGAVAYRKKKERERRKKDGEEPILMKLKCRGEEENDVNKSLFFHVWNCQLRVSTVHVWMLVNKVSCVCRVVMATTRGKTSAMSLWWWIPWSLRCHVKCGHICPKCVKVKRTNIFIRNARRRSVQRERFFLFF